MTRIISVTQRQKNTAEWYFEEVSSFEELKVFIEKYMCLEKRDVKKTACGEIIKHINFNYNTLQMDPIIEAHNFVCPTLSKSMFEEILFNSTSQIQIFRTRYKMLETKIDGERLSTSHIPIEQTSDPFFIILPISDTKNEHKHKVVKNACWPTLMKKGEDGYDMLFSEIIPQDISGFARITIQSEFKFELSA